MNYKKSTKLMGRSMKRGGYDAIIDADTISPAMEANHMKMKGLIE